MDGLGGETGMGGSGGEMGMPPEPVVPMVSGTVYSFSVGDVTFRADGATGRVTGLDFGGSNLLTGPSVNATNYGSSFWTAPQADWTWPPAVDAANYDHAIDMMNTIVFTSDPVQPNANDASIEWAVTKRFWGDAEHGSIVLEYTVENLGAAAISIAPWEITRVVATGITFYPQGDNEPFAQDGPYSPPAISTVTLDGGMVWYDFTGADTESKSVSDGSDGWLAHVAGGVLLLKTFDDVPANMQAPGEAEIEIYAGPDDSYIELEQQGPYASVPAGGTSAPWRVQWKVRAVPADLTVEVGSTALVDWVRSVVAE